MIPWPHTGGFFIGQYGSAWAPIYRDVFRQNSTWIYVREFIKVQCAILLVLIPFYYDFGISGFRYTDGINRVTEAYTLF